MRWNGIFHLAITANAEEVQKEGMPTNTPHLGHSHLSKQWSIAAVAKIVYHRIEVSHRSFIPWKLQRFPPTRKKVIFRMICQSQTYSSVSCKQIHFHWSGQPKVFNIKLIWEKNEKMCIFFYENLPLYLRIRFLQIIFNKMPNKSFLPQACVGDWDGSSNMKRS